MSMKHILGIPHSTLGTILRTTFRCRCVALTLLSAALLACVPAARSETGPSADVTAAASHHETVLHAPDPIVFRDTTGAIGLESYGLDHNAPVNATGAMVEAHIAGHEIHVAWLASGCVGGSRTRVRLDVQKTEHGDLSVVIREPGPTRGRPCPAVIRSAGVTLQVDPHVKINVVRVQRVVDGAVADTAITERST